MRVIYTIYIRCHLGPLSHLRFECTAIPLIFSAVPTTTEAFIIKGRSVCVTQWRHYVCFFLSTVLSQLFPTSGSPLNLLLSRLRISTGRRLVVADKFPVITKSSLIVLFWNYAICKLLSYRLSYYERLGISHPFAFRI